MGQAHQASCVLAASLLRTDMRAWQRAPDPRVRCRNSTKVVGQSVPITNAIPNDPRHGHLSYTSTPGCAACSAHACSAVLAQA